MNTGEIPFQAERTRQELAWCAKGTVIILRPGRRNGEAVGRRVR